MKLMLLKLIWVHSGSRMGQQLAAITQGTFSNIQGGTCHFSGEQHTSKALIGADAS